LTGQRAETVRFLNANELGDKRRPNSMPVLPAIAHFLVYIEVICGILSPVLLNTFSSRYLFEFVERHLFKKNKISVFFDAIKYCSLQPLIF